MRPGPGRLYPKNVKVSLTHTAGATIGVRKASSGGLADHGPKGEASTEAHKGRRGPLT